MKGDQKYDALKCGPPPNATVESLLIIQNVSEPMCPGKSVTYVCDAGGINKFEVCSNQCQCYKPLTQNIFRLI